MKTKVLLVDDYNIFRQGLKLLLEESDDLEVIGEAGNSGELFDVFSKIKPDVILLDLVFLKKNIVSISEKIKQRTPNIPFIILSVKEIENTLIDCIINGASGFIWKDSSVKELVKAIQKVAAGEKYFLIPESELFEKIINRLSTKTSKEHSGNLLTRREMEIVEHFATGKTYKEIAHELDISPRTVESHKNNILHKLNLNSRTELVRYAIKNKIVLL